MRNLRCIVLVLILLLITFHISGASYASISPTISGSFSDGRLTVGGGLSLEVGIPTSIGEVIPSVELAASFYHNYSGLDKDGVEYRISPMITLDTTLFSESLGTNLWYGSGELALFRQRTGVNVFTLKHLWGMSDRALRIMVENDGGPFTYLFLSDTEDRYRTASLYISMLDTSQDESVSLGMKLFTGNRLKEKETDAEPPAQDDFGKTYPFGFVHEVGEPFRVSLVYVDYRKGAARLRAGINNDRIRHFIQNWVAHGIMSSTDKAGFRIYDESTKVLFSPGVEFSTPYMLFGEDQDRIPIYYTSY